jgi:hypothetical protein
MITTNNEIDQHIEVGGFGIFQHNVKGFAEK